MIIKFSEFVGNVSEMFQHSKIDFSKLESITNSAEFKTFFKGSKMVHNSKPVVFFHGTKNKFTNFEKDKISSATDVGWLGKGFYFYSDYFEAEQYGNVSAYFLNITKPYKAKLKDVEKLAELNSHEASQKFTDKLILKGYDGVFYDDDLRGEAVVYENSQIFKIDFDISDMLV